MDGLKVMRNEQVLTTLIVTVLSVKWVKTLVLVLEWNQFNITMCIVAESIKKSMLLLCYFLLALFTHSVAGSDHRQRKANTYCNRVC